MKKSRHALILRLIEQYNISTQDELLEKLLESGISVTQATVSRDIKELRIVKELTHNGIYRYSAPSKESADAFSAKLNTIFKECVTSYDSAQNLVVIKTLPGLASAACSC